MKNKDIYLTEEQQKELNSIIHKGNHNSHEVTRANVLLMLDRTGKTDKVSYKQIAGYAGISPQAVANMRDEFLRNHDITSYLTRKKRGIPPVKPKLDEEAEAKLISLAGSKPPEGCLRWSTRLLAEKAVELHIVDSVSPMTIHRFLKKRNISLYQK